MVALDCSDALVHVDNDGSLGIKKSKKKKKNKCLDTKSINDSTIETGKINAMKEMAKQVENLTTQPSDKKEKHKKKKKDKQGEKEKSYNNMAEPQDFGDEECAGKGKKRKVVETVENSLLANNDTVEQSELQPKKIKKSESNEVDAEIDTKKEKKKNKKSKKERSIKENAADSKMLNEIQIENGSEKNGIDTSIAQPDMVPSNDVNMSKKKKKKEKKAKKEANKDVLNEKTEGRLSDNASEIQLKHNNNPEENDISPFKKDFYSTSYSSLAHDKEKEKSDAEQYRKDQKITMYGKGKSKGQLNPIRDFKQLGFEENMLTAVKNFKEPTPIQASAWPVIASGRDTIGIAETGSGKTLAFSIPALAHLKHRLDQQKVKKGPKRRGPMMLVVAPTRELAQQSQDVLEEAGKSCGIRSVSVYGGVSKDSQRRSLNANGCIPYEVVVATPGRLIDLMNEESCDLSDVSYLVLDEADRMLDQGFERDVRKIIGATHPHRQTCLFSATWPDSVRELAHEFLQNPIKITIGSDDLTAGSTIEQIVEVFDDDRQRQWRLLELLKKHQKSGGNGDKNGKNKRVLIFVLYKKEATRIEEFLSSKGFNVTSIQGDKSQDARQKAVDNFKAGTIPLLVATDVAARGLDIPGVDLVINYSFPLTIEDYVHRIGRTGRAGKKGIAHTFFQSKADKLRAGELVKVLRDAGQEVPEKMLSFDLSIRKKEHKLYGAFGPKEYGVPMKQPSKIVFGDD